MVDYLLSMSAITWLIIAVVVMLIEYAISALPNSMVWGGIIPIALVAFTVYVFVSGRLEFSMHNAFPLLVAITVYFSEWNAGRKTHVNLMITAGLAPDGTPLKKGQKPATGNAAPKKKKKKVQ